MKFFKQYGGLRKELYVLFICELIDHAGSMVGPLLTLILSTKLGMDAGGVAAYFLVYTLLSLPMHLLGGRLTDRVNKKLLINVCDIATSLIYIVCGIVGLSRTTLAVYLVGSLLQAVESPAYKSLVADFTSTNDRDRAYSLNYLGMNLGMVLAPTLGSFLIKDHLELMFVLSGSFELLSVIIFDFFIRDISVVRSAGNTYENDVEGKSAFQVLRDSDVLIPFLVIFSFSMLMYSMFGYLIPLSLTAAHGDTGSIYYGTVSSLNCVTVLVFTAILTAFFSKRTTIDRMVAGNAFELLGLAMFFFFLGRPVVYYIAMVIFTFGEILNTTTTTPHLTKRIPVNYRGRIMAISSVMSNVVGSLGKYALGKIYDLVSPDAAWITVLFLGAATIAGYLLMSGPDRRIYPALYKTDNG